MNKGKELFICNRSIPDKDTFIQILAIEKSWIDEIFKSVKDSEKPIKSKLEFQTAFDKLLWTEQNTPSRAASCISNEISLDEFRIIIQEFAVDGLTEAQSFFPIIPRLPMAAQMPIIRVLIDEFGCGNLRQLHSKLYCDLLSELGMSTNLNSYLDTLNSESFDFLNIFYWLAQRAPHVEYFLGALLYLESIIPFSFKCFADACQRLNIVNSQYYTEHMHIDDFHAKDCLLALKEVDSSVGLDYMKVWTGIQIVCLITGQAFSAAFQKATKEKAKVFLPINKNIENINKDEYLNSGIAYDDTVCDSNFFSITLKEKKYMISEKCPHRGGKMRLGFINKNSGTIVCPLHYSKFDLASGKPLSGPVLNSLDVAEITKNT